ncbi:hypothetical protein ACFE04_016078 [Oxalis oulophora]
MRRYAIFLLLFMILLFPHVPGLSTSQIAQRSFTNSIQSSLLPPSPKDDNDNDNLELAMVADLVGRVYLLDVRSGKIYWSFASGSPIYSSHHAKYLKDGIVEEHGVGQSKGFYVDCGDDWELYIHTKRFGKAKLGLSMDEYIKQTPLISEDGEITLGSKKTTVFVVNAETGSVLRTIESSSTFPVRSGEDKSLMLVKGTDDLVEPDANDMGLAQQLVYVTRTDYELKHYSSNSSKVLWNVTLAEINAEFRCNENFGDIELPFPCQMKGVVHRLHVKNLPEFEKLANAHHGGRVLSLPDSNRIYKFPLTISSNVDRPVPFDGFPLAIPNLEKSLVPADTHSDPFDRSTRNNHVLALPSSHFENPNMLSGGMNTLYFSEATVWSLIWSLFLPFIFFIAAIARLFHYRSSKQDKLSEKDEGSKVKASAPKRKKPRKSGKDKNCPSEEKDPKSVLQVNTDSERTPSVGISEHTDRISDGRRIGKLLVSSKEIARGSNGTVVLEGIYDGRMVAVKRLVKTHHDVALKEVQHLIASDQHANIVRWHGVEYDRDFVYLALERCTCSLNDLIYISSRDLNETTNKDQNSNLMDEYTVQLYSFMNKNENVELWKPNGYPSPQLLKLMRDVVSGLAHLHELGIVHRDLKPQNVLIIKERSLCAKLSDMGISKRLVDNMSSLTQNTTGYGSSGWQAPEQLLNQRQTRAVDLFSLGCLLFFCLTGGRHPYGDNIERDINIVNDRKDLFLVENMPEAVDLLSQLLDHNPDNRLKAQNVLNHPLFWSSEKRLTFLRDASDRVELEDRESHSEILNALENIAPVALNGGKWDEKMEPAFINNIGRYRRYKYDSVRDLLRVIRNKLSHYRELPPEIQELLGPIHEGFDSYFASRFPKLLIEVYKVLYEYCKEEQIFVNMILRSVTSPEYLSNFPTDEEQYPLVCKVKVSIKEKLHSVNTPEEKITHQTLQFGIHSFPDRLGAKCMCSDTFGASSAATYQLISKRHDKLFFGNSTTLTCVSSENRKKLLATVHDFANVEYNRIKIPCFIFADVAINSFDNFIFKENSDREDLGICRICLQRFNEDDQGLINTPCSHIFHGECMVDWIRAKKSCPICSHEFGLSLFT